MHRWDGSSTFPESLVNQGVPSKECVCLSRGMLLFINEEGIWATVGSYPKKISKPIQDIIEAISDFNEVYTWADDNNAYFSIGNITVKGETWNNCVLKLNLDESTFDVRSYAHPLFFITQYISSSSAKKIACGDNDGNILQLNSGYSDYNNKDIHLTYESHDIDFGMRGFIKVINNIHVFTENSENGQMLFRVDTKDQEWKNISLLNTYFTEIKNGSLKGRFFNFKIIDSVKNAKSKILGYDLIDVKGTQSTEI
jgi:hypothetical protein